LEQNDEEEEEGKEADVAYAFVGAVNKDVRETDFKFRAYVPELSKSLQFIVDTGADITCVSDECIPKKNRSKLLKTDKIISGPDGKKIPVIGYLRVILVGRKLKAQSKIYVIHGLKKNLLGKPEILKLDLIRKVNNIKDNNIRDIVSKYPEIFKGIGQFKKELNIEIKENINPYFQAVPRTVPIPLLPKLKKELDHLLKLKIIKTVYFPTEWCSPIVVVSKKGCDDIRLCCDYTKLNNSVKRANFPIPKVDVTLSSLKGSKIFSKLDAQSGFYQIKLNEKSQPYTTFITPFGRFMFTRLPFGINCAPDYFSQMFSELFRDLPGVVVHVDDILIHASDITEHNRILKIVLARLKNEGVTLNKKKCIFGVKQVEFLGHLISEKGISILPSRVSAILNFPTPKNKESLMQILGSLNYVSKYLPDKSHILAPLNSLLQDNTPFEWKESQQKAFEKIKNLLARAPTLAHYDY